VVGRTVIGEFKGLALDVHRTSMPADLFQVDEGGDRFNRGTWKRRRGMRHTTFPRAPDPIRTLLGFEMPGLDFGLLVNESTRIHGVLNVTEQ
jgi:hypothetical protein